MNHILALACCVLAWIVITHPPRFGSCPNWLVAIALFFHYVAGLAWMGGAFLMEYLL